MWWKIWKLSKVKSGFPTRLARVLTKFQYFFLMWLPENGQLSILIFSREEGRKEAVNSRTLFWSCCAMWQRKCQKKHASIADREAGNRVINVFRIIIFEPRRQKLISWLITSRWKPLSGSNLLITGKYWYNISAHCHHCPRTSSCSYCLINFCPPAKWYEPNTETYILGNKVELSKTLEIRIRQWSY